MSEHLIDLQNRRDDIYREREDVFGHILNTLRDHLPAEVLKPTAESIVEYATLSRASAKADQDILDCIFRVED